MRTVRGALIALLLACLAVAVTSTASPTTCESLAAAKFPNATITLAQRVEGTFTPPDPLAGGVGPPSVAPIPDLPPFCRVAATLKPSPDSDIKIEVWMPLTGWNGKFLGVGNGGWAGSISYRLLSDPLRRGYAVASTDTGHTGSGGDASFALGHPEKLIDFAYRAVHEMTVTGKAIATTFSGDKPRLSYWFGCSTGGKQGLTEAQRYPGDYDGIIGGAPANYWTHLLSHLIWVARATLDDPAHFVPSEKYRAVHRAVLDACDAADGQRDGIIANPTQCRFDPSVLQCKSGDAADCLTGSQVEAVRKIYGPLKNPKTGDVIFPGFMPGSEPGWGAAAGGPRPFQIPDTYFKFVVFMNPDWDFRTFDFDRDVAAADRADTGLNAIDPRLDAFERRHGKLLLYHGWIDPLISPLNTVNYYESVAKTMGADRAAKLVRLFMAPGMGHCGGGPGPNTLDLVPVLERWVEQGIAPDQVIATHRSDGKVDRTRPLCAYPAVAVYKGSGDPDVAESWTCRSGVSAPSR